MARREGRGAQGPQAEPEQCGGQAKAALPEGEGGTREQSTMEASGQHSQTQEKSRTPRLANVS